jgi:formylmethanofuran dehydrogenase subunit B
MADDPLARAADGASGDGRSFVQATANSAVAASTAAPEQTTTLELIVLLARKGSEKVTRPATAVKQEVGPRTRTGAALASRGERSVSFPAPLDRPEPSPTVPDVPLPAADHVVEHATCLGCGCACDDITVVVRTGRIAETRSACGLGSQWFGDGQVPTTIRAGIREGDPLAALAAVAAKLHDADRALVYLAADLPCETHRAAIAVADVLGAALDSITSTTAAPSVLAAQRRGRTTATLGELRNRADAVLFWGIDPAGQYPRFTTRYIPDPGGLFVPGGRQGRTVIAADIAADHGPADADARVAFTSDEEVAALGLVRAALRGRSAPGAKPESLDARAAALAERLRAFTYVAIVSDGEPAPHRDPRRAEALIALAETLNATTRCALSTLRAGGNRSGVDTVMTWQTGYPMAIDFARGAPRYRPADDAAALLARGEIQVALVVGAAASVPASIRDGLSHVSCSVIGPRASASPFPTFAAIDTGVAGIHERGTAVRLDEIPLPLRPALESRDVAAFHDQWSPSNPRVARATVSRLCAALSAAPSPGDDRAAQANRLRDSSPEMAVAAALAAAGRPQDSYILLRALGATLAHLQGVA